MKIYIKYNKKSLNYIIKLDKKLFVNLSFKKFISNFLLKKISFKLYNYIILLKLLRMFGLIKPLINLKDFK